MDFIAIVLDVGSHMYDGITNKSSITQGINSIKGLIQKKLFSESKDELAIILCGTQETENNLNDNDITDYEHISVIKRFSTTNWEFLELLDENDSKWGSDNGDLLESIVVAADLLVNHLKGRKAKGSSKIVVFSNLEGKIDFSQLDEMIGGLDEKDIEVNVISDREFHSNTGGDGMDEPSTSGDRTTTSSNEKLSQIKLTNEKELGKLVSRLNGVTYSFEDVLLSLDFFETKSVQPRGWKANLEISNICSISVVGYSKVKQVQPQTLKLRYGGDPSLEIEKRMTYHLNDGSNTAVSLEDTIKGFKYGNSLVPFTEEDIKSMEITKVKGLKLIGFCEDENVPRYLYVGDSSTIFVADKSTSDVAFTSLVHAMYETNMVALVRRVYSSASAPRLAAMCPVIKNESVYLVYCELAFGEDIRSYVFPSLPVSQAMASTSNHNKKKKPSVISDAQLKAVDSFIDQLMLTKKDSGNEDETEILKPSKTVSPSIQMFYQSASHKYLNPTGALPELKDHIKATLEIPMDNQQGLEGLINEIRSLFLLKNKENLSKKKKAVVEESANDNGSTKKIKINHVGNDPLPFGDIVTSHITEVGSATPVEDFLDLLGQGKVSIAIGSMQTRIWQLINDSYLDTLYSKAIFCLTELRNRAKEYSSSDGNTIAGFNEFLCNMKQRLLVSAAKRDFWILLKTENINLIGESESEFGCSEDDSQHFFEVKQVIVPVTDQTEEEMDTLFEDM